MNIIRPTVDNPDEILTGFGAGALGRCEFSADGSTGWTEFATFAIVTGTTQYTVYHAAGATTTWYRLRYSKALPGVAADYSGYGASFQATALAAYASLDDLLETMTTPSTDDNNVLSDFLVRASDRVDQLCGRQFYRNPQVSGDGTFTLHVTNPRTNRLSAALGHGIDIVSVTSLSLAYYTGGPLGTVALGASGYFLWPDVVPLGQPYTDLILSDYTGTYYYWPRGYGTIVLTGVLGFPSVPPLVQQATIDLAREWFRQGPGGGGPVGINAFGTPVFGPGTPSSVMDLYNSDYRRQSFAHV